MILSTAEVPSAGRLVLQLKPDQFGNREQWPAGRSACAELKRFSAGYFAPDTLGSVQAATNSSCAWSGTCKLVLAHYAMPISDAMPVDCIVATAGC